jgi:hypothetical protein
VFELKLDGEKEHDFVPALETHVLSVDAEGLALRERP